MRLVRPVVFSAVVALLGGVLGGAAAQGATDQTISYHGYQVTVPAGWPVVDLAKDPTACVRFDRPAVYLGRSSAQDCPARIVGRSEGLVLEPLTRAAKSSDGELQVAVQDAGVLATAYYVPGADQTARKVLSTGRVTSKSQAARVAPQAVAAEPTIVATGTIAAPGFDKCTAPSQSEMDAWLFPASPYRAVGIYTSGSLRGCQQPNLTPDWVATNAAKGWQFLLIDVGMQAPCTTYNSRMSSVPATALTQGRNAAINAVAAAQALGIAQRSAIYSDIEYYVSTAACKASVLSYLSGWTQELNSRGYVGGAYVNASSGGADLASAYASTAYTRPDNIWFAHYNTTPGSSRFIPDTYWPNHQRVHQHTGDVKETHGGAERAHGAAIHVRRPVSAERERESNRPRTGSGRFSRRRRDRLRATIEQRRCSAWSARRPGRRRRSPRRRRVDRSGITHRGRSAARRPTWSAATAADRPFTSRAGLKIRRNVTIRVTCARAADACSSAAGIVRRVHLG